MNLTRIPALLLLICLASFNSPGQKIHFQFSRLDISKGLSNNQVNSFFKDQKGFLWVGTMSGLNRYDGYQFKVFRHDLRDTTTLSDDFINGITEGPGDKLWIQTRNGFNIYDPVTEKFDRDNANQLRKLGIPGGSISVVFKNKDGDFLFLINQHTIYKYVVATGKSFILYKANASTRSVTAIAEDNKKQYWVIYASGVAEAIDSRTGKLIRQTDIPSKVYGKDSVHYSLFIDNESELWIYGSAGNPKGVIRFNSETGSYSHIEKDFGNPRLNTNLVVNMQQDNNGNIWICTDHGGVNIYDKKDSSINYLLNNIDDDKSLSQNSITAAYKDNTGIIWLGTYKKGISYYHENIIKFPVYRHQPSNPNSLSFDDVNRFVEDPKGNLWIGTNGGGLLYFDRGNNKFTQFLHQPENPNSISNNVIVSLWIDRKQRLWIGSYFGGLDCYENGKFTHFHHDPANPNSLSDDRVWEIFEDSQENLWVGTLNGGLERFDRKNNIFYHHNTSLPNSLHSNYIAAIVEDREGSIWVGTNNGIDILDHGSGRITHFENTTNIPGGLSNNNIISILQDSRGLIWVGTSDGLNVYNKEKKNFQSFRMENGLPGSAILNILEDNKGQLWISTNNGISKIRVSFEKNVVSPVKISCINYDESDGLQGTEFNENAALKTSKGEIVFGGANGFNLFYPDNIVTGNSLPDLVLTDLQIFNKPVGIGEKVNGRVVLSQSISKTSTISLTYNENILSLEFAALNFSNPEKIKYEYVLEGFSNNWLVTDGKMRKAIYTNLDPGTYTFRLKASNEEGKWYEKELSLKIKILPPFWRTPIAFVLYALVIIAALWFGRRIILERARMRFEVEHQRKEAERVQALDAMKTKFFTNVSHEFRTPLSLILSPLDKIIKKSADADQKKQLHLVERNAKRLLNLVNQLLDFRKMEVQEFTVQLSKEDIIRFTKDITYSFSDISEKKDIQLSFKSNVERLLTFFDKDKLEKILFNLLSNAFKYTHSKGNVAVEMSFLDGKNGKDGSPSIVIKIRDDGIGIPADMHKKIFEPYFQQILPGNMHNYGTGIGLAITKEFVKLHQGIITVESLAEKGACFAVTLPVKTGDEIPAILEAQQIALINDKEASLGIDINENGNGQVNHHSKKNTILLVEDNEDFRFYLKDNLKHRYHVIEAVNGKEGLEKVRNFHPDLVVSDIMMPVLNGIELSKKIKSNPDTSHTPVILLTALSTVETELEGFSAGINDYITKPFTFEILASRIRSLLNLQEQLRKKFQKLVEINPAEITITPVDEEFMKRALESVEKNIHNPDFSVEDLSRELFISRVALYKKLLSLTGKSPIEFIRVMRLKRAAQLLKKSQLTVAEIAYEVGFNNPKIFSRYFKTEFGSTPSQYQDQLPAGED